MTYILEIHRYNPTDPRLGRHIHHDSRSRAYGFTFLGAPKVVRHHSNLPITDQGNVGACVGFSCVDLLGYDVYWNTLSADQKATISADPNAEGLNFYHQATALDSYPGTYPPNDTGSDGTSGAKGMHKLGFISGYQHCFGMSAFYAALNRGPVMVGTDWYNSMFDTDVSGNVSVDTRSGLAGGHEYVADEYTADDRIGFRNHWSSGWGKEGRFYIKRVQFEQMLAAKGDATVPTPLSLPAPEPTPVPPTPTPTPQPTPPVPVDPSLLAAWHSMQDWARRNGLA